MFLALSAVLLSPVAAHATVGYQYKYYGSGSSGSAVRLVGDTGSTTHATYLYGLQGYSPSSAPSPNSYSLDYTGTVPTSNTTYTESAWSAVDSVRGAVEWIVKNSYPSVDVTPLRSSAKLGSYLSTGDAVGATQAAIWYFTASKSLDTASSKNSANAIGLYNYLISNAAGQKPSNAPASSLTLQNVSGRSVFSVAPNGWFGPFTVQATTSVTLTAGASLKVVDVNGTALTGAIASGASFWLQPTASPAADGSATLTATGQAVTTTVIDQITATGKLTLEVPSSATSTATGSLAVSWAIDRSSAGSFDSSGGATNRSYDYFAKGVKSATLQDVYFADGDHTVTDLAGLTGSGSTSSADVYSADYTGTASLYGPIINSGTHYTEADYSSAGLSPTQAGQIGWVLKNSYPNLTTANLTATVRSAGLPLGTTGDVPNWEAIAATQAAVWHFSNGKNLDLTRYPDPVSATGVNGSSASAVIDGNAATSWNAPVVGTTTVDFGFRVPVEVRQYTVTGASGANGGAPASWKLQRSSDGSTWTDVSSSAGVASSPTTVLGGSATYGGYTHYRLQVTPTDITKAVALAEVHFDGFGVFGSQPNLSYSEYANSTSIVGIYKYLVAQATAAPIAAPAPVLSLTASSAAYVLEPNQTLIGPFTVTGSTAASLSFGAAPSDAKLVSQSGTPATSLLLSAGSQFWVQPGTSTSGAVTVNATGSSVSWTTAKALKGVDRLGVAAPNLTQLGVSATAASASITVSFAAAPAPHLALTSGPGGITQTSFHVGDPVVIHASGFRPNETVELQLHSAVIVLTQVTADSTGTISVAVAVPSGAVPGDHHVVAIGQDSGRSVEVPVTITPVGVPVSTPLVTTTVSSTPAVLLAAESGPVQGTGSAVPAVVPPLAQPVVPATSWSGTAAEQPEIQIEHSTEGGYTQAADAPVGGTAGIAVFALAGMLLVAVAGIARRRLRHSNA